MASCYTKGEGLFPRGAIPVAEFELLLALQYAYSSSDANDRHVVEVLMAHYELRPREAIALHAEGLVLIEGRRHLVQPMPGEKSKVPWRGISIRIY